MSIEVEKEENGNDIYSHLIDLCFLELDYMVLNEHFRNQMDYKQFSKYSNKSSSLICKLSSSPGCGKL